MPPSGWKSQHSVVNGDRASPLQCWSEKVKVLEETHLAQGPPLCTCLSARHLTPEYERLMTWKNDSFHPSLFPCSVLSNLGSTFLLPHFHSSKMFCDLKSMISCICIQGGTVWASLSLPMPSKTWWQPGQPDLSGLRPDYVRTLGWKSGVLAYCLKINPLYYYNYYSCC